VSNWLRSPISPRGNLEVHAHAARAVIAHLIISPRRLPVVSMMIPMKFSARQSPAAQRLEVSLPFSVRVTNLGLAHHHSKPSAASFRSESRLQFAASQHAEGFRRVGVFHANGYVGQKFFLQAVAEVARSQIGSVFARKRTAVDGEIMASVGSSISRGSSGIGFAKSVMLSPM